MNSIALLIRKDEYGEKIRETIEEGLQRGDVLRQKWDKDPTVADVEMLSYAGLSPATQRKHMRWISALMTHLDGHQPDFTPKGLNFSAVRKTLVNPKKQRDRHYVKNNNETNMAWLR